MMEATKHTQGEWKAVELSKKIGGCTHEIHFNDDGECITDGVYGEANANLIAAAPKLLEALDNCLQSMLILSGADPSHKGLKNDIKMVENAIKKALPNQ